MIGSDQHRIRDYVAAMSLLGNDFLPRSLTHSVRDDGIPALISVLEKKVWSDGLHLVNASGALDRVALLALVDAWASAEQADMLAAVMGAAAVARRPAGIADSPEETAMREWNAQPARWNALSAILQKGALRPQWQEIYRKQWRAGSASDYCRGLAWVWNYYSGRAVDQGWFFDEHLPPLWSDVAAQLRAMPGAVVAAPIVEHHDPLPDWLHLLAVLPADSVKQLLPAHVQQFMISAAQYWPTSWALFDVGRTQMWECEPVIPMIPERLLRSWSVSGSVSASAPAKMKAAPSKSLA
jgi:5'-3' exonuclease